MCVYNIPRDEVWHAGVLLYQVTRRGVTYDQ